MTAACSDAQLALATAEVGERKALLAALRDSATGLPNREHFNSRRTHDIAVAARQGFELQTLTSR